MLGLVGCQSILQKQHVICYLERTDSKKGNLTKFFICFNLCLYPRLCKNNANLSNKVNKKYGFKS